MPRKDPTFNYTNVLRIAEKYLTPEERMKLILALKEKSLEESNILNLLHRILDGTTLIFDLVEPALKMLLVFPILRPIIIVIEVIDVIVAALVELIEFFENP